MQVGDQGCEGRIYRWGNFSAASDSSLPIPGACLTSHCGRNTLIHLLGTGMDMERRSPSIYLLGLQGPTGGPHYLPGDLGCRGDALAARFLNFL